MTGPADPDYWTVPIARVEVPVTPRTRVDMIGEPLGGLLPDGEDRRLCGYRFHLFGGGPDFRCGLDRDHPGEQHHLMFDGGWYYVPPGGHLRSEGAMAGIASGHIVFIVDTAPEAPQLPDATITPHEARAVLGVAEGGPYVGYPGDWARQLVALIFKSDRSNRDALMFVYPAWVSAVDQYERNPVPLRDLATLRAEDDFLPDQPRGPR